MKIQYQSNTLILFESALFRTITSLIIGSDYILLVDPNWLPIEIDFIKKMVDSVSGNKKRYLFFTHSDYDHIIGYERFKEYTTIASESFVKSPTKEKVLQEIATFDDEYYIKRTYPISYPIIDIVIAEDDQTLTIGSDTYSFFQAKGHNHDGLFAYNSTQHIIIAGDYLSNIEFPYIYDSAKRYLNTLDKFDTIIQNNPIARLITGHGDSTTDKAAMVTRLKDAKSYIHQLVQVITLGKVFDEGKLFLQYDFPISMKAFHDKNMMLAKKEFRLKS